MRSALIFGSIVVLACLAVFVFHFPSLQIIQTSNAQVNGTSDIQVNSTFKKYENPKFGLTLSYPSTWSLDERRSDPDSPSSDSIVVIFKSESQGQNDKYLENFIINVQGPNSDLDSLETYTKDSIEDFRSMSDIKITESMKDTLSGFPAHQLQYTSKTETGAFQEINLKKMQVFTVVDNVAYVVTFGSEQSEYDKNIQDAEYVINSIRIDPDKF